jgi:hypothetical protein
VRGCYFLANDEMLEFTIAFLNSFRHYNPSQPLCLVPYDDKADRVAALQAEYGFEIWSDDATLRRCDAISRHFHSWTVGHYRKLAIWDGPYDQFVYIDIDTVVLNSIEFMFPLISVYGLITSHSNMPELRRWVWKDSIDQAGVLSEAQKSFSANTGFIGSKRGYLSLDIAERKLAAGVEVKPHMELLCAEQPFLNYLIVTSGQAHTSLHVLGKHHQMQVPIERWAGMDIGRVVDGVINPGSPQKTLLVHWAGERRKLGTPEFSNPEIWAYYRNLRPTPPIQPE